MPVGDGIEKQAVDWLQEFAISKRRLLLYQIQSDWYALGPPDFQTEMFDRLNRGENIWSLSTAIDREATHAMSRR